MTVRAKVVSVSLIVLVVSLLLMLLKVQTGFGGDRLAAIEAIAFLVAMYVFQSNVGPLLSMSQLQSATNDWTTYVIVRSYPNDGSGRSKAQSDAEILAMHGYVIVGQSGTGGHVNVGRTVTPAVLTGGISLLFGASRSKGTIDLTFIKG